MTDASTQKLMDDLRAVVSNAEALLEATAHDLSEGAREARRRAAESVEQARASLDDLDGAFTQKARAAAEETNRYVHANPWQSIGVAAAIGVIVGVLIGRR